MKQKQWRAICLVSMWFCVAHVWHIPDVLANSRICTSDEEKAAEATAAISGSWKQLHRNSVRYAHCDDGAIAEGFSESVAMLLAEHWQAAPQLERVLRSDSAFRTFVLRHINETVPVERLKRIAINARTRCPQSMKVFCQEVEAAAK